MVLRTNWEFLPNFVVILNLYCFMMPLLSENYVRTIGGAKRWIDFRVISITPVEFYKIGFIMFVSWSLVRKRLPKGRMALRDEIKVFIPYLFILFISILLIAVFQKDLGQTVVISVRSLSYLWLCLGRQILGFLSQ